MTTPKNGRPARKPMNPLPPAPKLRPFKAIVEWAAGREVPWKGWDEFAAASPFSVPRVRVQWVMLDQDDVEYRGKVQEVAFEDWDAYVAALPEAFRTAGPAPPEASS